jgi:hypothetical protein
VEEHAAPPEAVLIERLRLAHSPKLSVTKAAKLADISEGRWRQIAKGYQQASTSTRVPVRAPADTLARMAEVVGATPDQLREAGREDAAKRLEESQLADAQIPPDVRGGNLGLRGAMRRSEIMDKPLDERTPEETEWLAAYDDAHPRKLDPKIFPTGDYRAFEVIFGDWQSARNKMLNLTLEYAATRKISFEAAEIELAHVARMATDVSLGTGRPWTPPWNPGPEYLPGDEPWNAHWWASYEVVDAGYLGEQFAGRRINQVSISTGWDPERARAFHAAQGDEWAPDQPPVSAQESKPGVAAVAGAFSPENIEKPQKSKKEGA